MEFEDRMPRLRQSGSKGMPRQGKSGSKLKQEKAGMPPWCREAPKKGCPAHGRAALRIAEEDAPVGAEWLHEGDAPLNKRRLQKEGRSSKFCDAPAVGERLQERDAPPSKSRLTREVQEEEVEENMLKRGISAVVGGKRKEASKEKKQGTDYISEEYAVRKGKMRDIIFRLGCGEPSVDGFATVENHLFPVWLGPGGYVENSLAAQWGT